MSPDPSARGVGSARMAWGPPAVRATFLPFGPLANTVEPFRTLDIRYYAPLILVIGLGYLALLGSVLRAL